MSVTLAAVTVALATLAALARQPEAPPAEPPAHPAPDQPAADQPAAGQAPEQTPANTPPTEEPATQPGQETLTEPALAERLAEMAQLRLREKAVTAEMWRQSAELLAAATRLSPRDPRFPRLLVEARLKVGDVDGAIDALVAYRKVDPADRVAQNQLIDLYAGRMQTADERLSYLRDLVGRASLPDEVRSHVAALCVPLLAERSEEEAQAMLAEALRLFPLNPTALRQQYELLSADAPAPQRVAVLLTMLRSNPVQPDVISELADLLASVGLGQPSIEWYSIAMHLYPRLGRPFPEGFVDELGAQLLMTNQMQPLDGLLDVYLKARPDDPDGWFMRLVREGVGSGGKIKPEVLDAARQALTGRIATLKAAMEGREPPATAAATTQPAGGAAPFPAPKAPAPASAPTTSPAGADVAAMVKQVKAPDGEQWHPALVSVLSDLAWFEVFFAEDADAAARWIQPLRQLLPGDNVTVARLDGWVDLVAGRAEEAANKLAAIADRDPLSAMGQVRLTGKDAAGQAQGDERAGQLLGTYRRGLVGAMLWAGLRERHVKAPESPAAADVRAELQKMPRDWMEILNQPSVYYSIQPEVLKVAHKYREPMFGRITITNRTDYDLTVGPDGVIRPDLWFDARLGGLVNQPFPGAAFDRISRVTVLRAKQQTVQYVRIDQGVLGQVLANNPSASAKVNVNVLTNPAPVSGAVGPGPAGYRQTFNKDFVRSGFPFSQPVARRRLAAAVQQGTTAEKVRGLDLMAAYVRLFNNAKEIDEGTKALGTEFAGAITAARRDANALVSAWASYHVARLNDNDRPAALEALTTGEAWPARLMALLAAAEVAPDQLEKMAKAMAEKDADPVVKAYAAATVDYLKNPPATQPSTTQPAAPPSPGGPSAGAGPTAPTTTER